MMVVSTRNMVFIGAFAMTLTQWAFAKDAPPRTLTEEEREQGFQLLFDGKTMASWRNYQSEGINPQWQVIDGQMVLTEKGGKDLVTKQEFQYFDLRLEYTIAEDGNSGIMFRVDENTEHRLPWMAAPEFQLYDSYNIKGDPKRAAGSLYGLIGAPEGVARKPGKWNQVRILLMPSETDCDHLQCWLNGVQTIDIIIDPTPGSEWSNLVAERNEEKKGTKFELPEDFFRAKRGNILLQDHGAQTAFRNIRVRNLGETK